MEEKNAVLAALKALGEKIISIEEERDSQKTWREIAENKVRELTAENDKLNRKLAEVQNYIERMGMEGN